jgi:hypothetical protein
MTAGKFPVLHQVTVEFMGNRPPLVYDLNSFDEAQRCIETLKRNPEAWHIFHSVQKHHRGKLFVELSLYRSHESRRWECRFAASESPSEDDEAPQPKPGEP